MEETKNSTTKKLVQYSKQTRTNSKQTRTNSKQTQNKLTPTKTRGKKNNNPYPPTQIPTQPPTKINNHRNRDTYHAKLVMPIKSISNAIKE